MSIAEAVPILGPLLADAQFRWWLLGLLLALGPVPEDVTLKSTKKAESGGEIIETSTITKWRFGGLLRVLMTAAASHSRLADRVASLETTVQFMGSSMSSFTAELRLWRASFERAGLIGSSATSSSSGTRLAVRPETAIDPLSDRRPDRRSESGLRVGSGGA